MFLFFVFSAANAAQDAKQVPIETLATDFFQPHHGFALEEIKKVESIDFFVLPNQSLRSLAQFLVLRGLDADAVNKHLAKLYLHKLNMGEKIRAVLFPLMGLYSYTNHSFGDASIIFTGFSCAAAMPFVAQVHWQAKDQLPKALCHQADMACQKGNEIQVDFVVGDDDAEFLKLIKESLDEKSPVMVLLSKEPSGLPKPQDKGAHYSILVGYEGDKFYVLNTRNQVFSTRSQDLLHAMDWSDTWYKKCVSNYRWVCEGTYGRYIAIR